MQTKPVQRSWPRPSMHFPFVRLPHAGYRHSIGFSSSRHPAAVPLNTVVALPASTTPPVTASAPMQTLLQISISNRSLPCPQQPRPSPPAGISADWQRRLAQADGGAGPDDPDVIDHLRQQLAERTAKQLHVGLILPSRYTINSTILQQRIVHAGMERIMQHLPVHALPATARETLYCLLVEAGGYPPRVRDLLCRAGTASPPNADATADAGIPAVYATLDYLSALRLSRHFGYPLSAPGWADLPQCEGMPDKAQLCTTLADVLNRMDGRLCQLHAVVTASAPSGCEEAMRLLTSAAPLRAQLGQMTALRLHHACSQTPPDVLPRLQQYIGAAGLQQILRHLPVGDSTPEQRRLAGKQLVDAGAHLSTVRAWLALDDSSLTHSRGGRKALLDILVPTATTTDHGLSSQHGMNPRDLQAQSHRHLRMINHRFGYPNDPPAWHISGALLPKHQTQLEQIRQILHKPRRHGLDIPFD